MNLRIGTGFTCIVTIAAFLAFTPLSHATLGESADTVTRDAESLAAAKGMVTIHGGYRIQTMATDTTAVREYISGDGKVFAIAWNGLVPPDLTTLLGSYAMDYSVARQQQQLRARGQKSQRLQSDRVVVETWGHMRNLQGRAYVPAMVPAGVDVNEIH